MLKKTDIFIYPNHVEVPYSFAYNEAHDTIPRWDSGFYPFNYVSYMYGISIIAWNDLAIAMKVICILCIHSYITYMYVIVYVYIHINI